MPAVLSVAAQPAPPVIDIHQHTHYWGRNDEDLIRHQRALGVTKTVLLPAGSKFGLEADCYGNDSVLALAKKYPKEFVFFANEVADLPEARTVIEKYLKAGAVGIGEQKFFVDCDSNHIELIAALAKDYNVPVLMHFQHGKYNTNFERFHKVLEKFPRVNFIGHAQTFWGNIDRNHEQTVLYPKGKLTPGGLTDRWLADYANFYGDLSAGSGLNALLRDEDFTRAFFTRHQNKLMYGSDCQDADTKVKECSGIKTLEVVRRLSASRKVERKLLYENARRVLKIK
ncbi:MAG TPA: amidohydrolase family protein [Blastocatellia bacterium]|nr:amidohydrolase family protein [Blastocatellia bacterium]HMV83581.1 amidohydrolase family protein [Blastocatellia bacterium]HMY76622.1 amidohydrolase family protein [Blastocatellia bacterium]HMZ19137.1 amidohydrolase family protein [Blastocatellia bacterium]HNG28446.1 amidohydrolase family protein [Blastocatellia bacterium]